VGPPVLNTGLDRSVLPKPENIEDPTQLKHDVAELELVMAAHERENQNVFRMLDKDGSGSIDAQELGRAMYELGMQVSAADVSAIIAAADKNKSGTIELDEFMQALHQGEHLVAADPCSQAALHMLRRAVQEALLLNKWKQKVIPQNMRGLPPARFPEVSRQMVIGKRAGAGCVKREAILELQRQKLRAEEAREAFGARAWAVRQGTLARADASRATPLSPGHRVKNENKRSVIAQQAAERRRNFMEFYKENKARTEAQLLHGGQGGGRSASVPPLGSDPMLGCPQMPPLGYVSQLLCHRAEQGRRSYEHACERLRRVRVNEESNRKVSFLNRRAVNGNGFVQLPAPGTPGRRQELVFPIKDSARLDRHLEGSPDKGMWWLKGTIDPVYQATLHKEAQDGITISTFKT